jgi:hypothetical protein
MTRELDTGARSAGDRARAHAYYRDFWPGIVGYVAVLAAVMTWGQLDQPSTWRYLWVLLPVLPALWVVRAVARHVGRIDDYQRLLLLQGLAVGFAIAMVAAITVGFLAIAGLVLPAAGWLIYGAGMLGWAVSGVLARRR